MGVMHEPMCGWPREEEAAQAIYEAVAAERERCVNKLEADAKAFDEVSKHGVEVWPSPTYAKAWPNQACAKALRVSAAELRRG